MSRAVFAVVMCGSNDAVADEPHFSATPATRLASSVTSAAFLRVQRDVGGRAPRGQVAGHRRAVADPARVDPDHVVAVQHVLRQPKVPQDRREVEPCTTRPAGVGQQHSAALRRVRCWPAARPRSRSSARRGRGSPAARRASRTPDPGLATSAGHDPQVNVPVDIDADDAVTGLSAATRWRRERPGRVCASNCSSAGFPAEEAGGQGDGDDDPGQGGREQEQRVGDGDAAVPGVDGQFGGRAAG